MASLDINLSDVIEEMFLLLTPKEKDVIIKRFSLDNKPKRTLESIGQQFSVTRERIRQIEKIALTKLRRTVRATKLEQINRIADELIARYGGVMLEDTLISMILNEIDNVNDVDRYIVRLSLSINESLSFAEKTNLLAPFWRKSDISLNDVITVSNLCIKVLKKKNIVLPGVRIIHSVMQLLPDSVVNITDKTALSCLNIDLRIKSTDDGFGLMTWRHINPKSIRDKAYIILKKKRKPLHFIEISNLIASSGFDKKVVTTQAVHNELIRYDQFVLVGRGLYSLKEFGYNDGTVSDVITTLLEKKSPLTKQEIIDGVLKQRHVKKGTISLNLQKNPQFVRVGRAVYALDKTKIRK